MRTLLPFLIGGFLLGSGCATGEGIDSLGSGGMGGDPFGSGGASTGGTVTSTGGFPPAGTGGFLPQTGGSSTGGSSGTGGSPSGPCGACPTPPNGMVVCTGGVCDFTCNAGFSKTSTGCARIVTCTDGQKNGNETDVDCGGRDCPGCEPGLACGTDSDCERGPCESGGTCGCTPETCESSGSCASSFDDGCGEMLDCSDSCATMEVCFEDTCCAPAAECDATTCSATFSDGCGGMLDCTGNCASTEVCFEEMCCTPVTQCDATTTCGQTTDGCGVDLACPPCADGGPCATGADCESTVCETGRCVSCTDGQQNNGETDVDCGGASCPKCPSDRKCMNDSDCESDTCCAAFGPFACILQPANTCL